MGKLNLSFNLKFSKNKIFFRYEQPDIALNSGMMLRECCRYEELTKIILSMEEFYKFFKFVDLSTFDIASDAFLTFRVSHLLKKVFFFFNNFNYFKRIC